MQSRLPAMLPLLTALGLLLGAAAGAFLAPGCPVREWTGLKCPGCGAGRAVSALLTGNASAAFYWNALLFPAFALLLVASFRRPWRWRGWLLFGLAVLAFGVARNLPFYLLY